MEDINFDAFPWIEPWQAISARGREAYEHELRLEICLDHPLYGVPVRAIGRTCHTDDVLFVLREHHLARYAVVHLTFRGRQELDPQWPSVVLYRDLEHWISKRLLPDAAAYEIDQAA